MPAPLSTCLLVLAVTLTFSVGLGWAVAPFVLVFFNEFARWAVQTQAALESDVDE